MIQKTVVEAILLDSSIEMDNLKLLLDLTNGKISYKTM